VINIPIISISINENLKKFINKLVSKNAYANKSKIIRDALLRLMSTIDVSSVETFGDIQTKPKNIVGSMIIVVPTDINVQKKLNRIENDFKDYIVSKNQNFIDDTSIIYLMFNGELTEFQKVVVEINSIEEIKNFRYLIIN
jgi:metal-responsive CopG/Arc/MetJ family transcriptional regulator